MLFKKPNNTVEHISFMDKKYYIIYSKDKPQIIKKYFKDCGIIQKKARTHYFFSNPFMEERLFPWLWPIGRGGFNNTWTEVYNFTEYAKLHLLTGITDRYRNYIPFIFYLRDRRIKERIYSFNMSLQMQLISEVKPTLVDDFKEHFDSRLKYYDSIGKNIDSSIKFSHKWNKTQFYN